MKYVFDTNRDLSGLTMNAFCIGFLPPSMWIFLDHGMNVLTCILGVLWMGNIWAVFISIDMARHRAAAHKWRTLHKRLSGRFQ